MNITLYPLKCEPPIEATVQHVNANKNSTRVHRLVFVQSESVSRYVIRHAYHPAVVVSRVHRIAPDISVVLDRRQPVDGKMKTFRLLSTVPVSLLPRIWHPLDENYSSELRFL